MGQIVNVIFFAISLFTYSQPGNTSYGTNALSSITKGGNQNAAFGINALRNNTSGYENTAMGFWPLYANINGEATVGLLAQDIIRVFPELVKESKVGMLSVNYQGLIPVLINAIKEQEAKIKEQEVKNEEQDQRLARLEALFLK